MTRFDVGIVGLGAMGSAAAHALTARGASVVGFDQLTPPHTLGSTHGHTRIIREAYYEHPLYVPLVRRAYELWAELEREAALPLWAQTGGLMVGPERGALLSGAMQSARTHRIAHELLDADALHARFPAYRARRDWVALLEYRAGVLFPERCVEAFLSGARARGADLHVDERVTGWSATRDGVRVATNTATFDVTQLVVAAGPWFPGLRTATGVDLPLVIERQLSHWFEPMRSEDGLFTTARCPIALWETKPDDVFATLPDEGHGVKCGTHHAGATTSPDTVNRDVSEAENAAARAVLETVMPGGAGRLLDARVCLYTNTPDHHFIVDWLPTGRVLLVSACSGHGFKFASAIGEIVAQLVLDGRSWLDLEPFSLSRFE